MMIFSDEERDYIWSQRLARLATAGKAGQPDVAAVVYHFDGTRFIVGGVERRTTRRERNIKSNPRVALVVDDAPAGEPWRTRGVKVEGRAEVFSGSDGRPRIRILPERKWSWGIEHRTAERRAASSH